MFVSLKPTRSNIVATVTCYAMAICKACNSSLQTIEYQARSADEATRVTTTCPSCPLDASKVRIQYKTMSYPRGLRHSVRSSRRSYSSSKLVAAHVVSRVSVDATSAVPNLGAPVLHVVQGTQSMRPVSIGGASDARTIMKFQVSGTSAGYCEHVLERTIIGFGAVLEVVQLYHPPQESELGAKILEGTINHVRRNSASATYLYTSAATNKKRVVVQYDGSIDAVSAAGVVSELYSSLCPPASLSAYVERRVVRELANLCPRAWDVPTAPTSGYTFTSKPDGERMWLICYGLFWYAKEVQRDSPMLKWTHNGNSSTPVLRPIVCDVEYTVEQGFIFIDVLTDADGSHVPIMRDIGYSISALERIRTVVQCVPVTLREYFDNNDDAVRYCGRVRYATDGTLGIRNGSTETVKIKSTKAVELLLNDGGSLTTRDGDIVAVISEYDSSYVGKVLEVRFTASPGSNFITVLDVFPRTNKLLPNSSEATENILRSCIQFNSATDAQRTMVVKWCNVLCKTIVERALRSNDSRHIILDIGTGSGQSLDRFIVNDSVSYVYVEPDSKRALSLSRRARCKLLKSAEELGPLVKSLVTRRVQQVVVNCSLQDVLSNEELCKSLCPQLKCAISTFSAQFVVNELRTLKASYGCNIYGCMYTYDDAVNDVLIDSCGATMRVTGTDTATVKWGSENYEEPATYECDYWGIGSVVRGSDILALPAGVESGEPRKVCTQVRVLLP